MTPEAWQYWKDIGIVAGVMVSVLTGLGLLWRGLFVLINIRDDNRDMAKDIKDLSQKIGQKSPPAGLVGDIDSLQMENRGQSERLVAIETRLQMKRKDDPK